MKEGFKQLIKDNTPEAKQLKLMLANWGVHFSIGIIASAVKEVGAKSVLGLLKFAVLRDENFLKEALTGRTIALVSAGTVSISLLYKLNEALVERISSLYTEDFYDRIYKDKKIMRAVTLYNDNNIDKPLNLAEIANAEAEINKYWYDNWLGRFLAYGIGCLSFTYLTTPNAKLLDVVAEVNSAANRVLLIVVGLGSIIILIRNDGIYTASVRKLVNQENEALAKLRSFLNMLEKGDIVKMGAGKLVPGPLKELFAAVRSSTALSQPYKICMGLLDVARDLMKLNIENIHLLTSAYESPDSFIKSLTATLLLKGIKKFDDRGSNDYKIQINGLNDAIIKTRPLAYSDVSEFVDAAVVLYGNIALPNKKYLAYIRYSIAFKSGEVTVIKGPSGCGKSTLVDIITGNSNRLHDGAIGFSAELIDVSFEKRIDRCIKALEILRSSRQYSDKEINDAIEKRLYLKIDWKPEALAASLSAAISAKYENATEKDIVGLFLIRLAYFLSSEKNDKVDGVVYVSPDTIYNILNTEFYEDKIQVVSSKEYEGMPHTTLVKFITGKDMVDDGAELGSILKALDFGKEFYEHLAEQMPVKLSNGQGKRLLVARGIYNKVKLMTLDETFASVSNDPSHGIFEGTAAEQTSARDRFMKVVKQFAQDNNAAIICISHEAIDAGFAKFADSLVEFEKNMYGAYEVTQREMAKGLGSSR